MPISNFHVRYIGLALRRGLEERGIWESLAHGIDGIDGI